jgi:hypothetical protein
MSAGPWPAHNRPADADEGTSNRSGDRACTDRPNHGGEREMTAVNYDDFCNLWRIYDRGTDATSANYDINACFTIYRQNDVYYYSANRGFKGGMNNAAVALQKNAKAHGEYDGGDSLDGGLTAIFNGVGPITFSLNRMGEAAYVISLTRNTAAGVTAQTHGGAHGVPD